MDIYKLRNQKTEENENNTSTFFRKMTTDKLFKHAQLHLYEYQLPVVWKYDVKVIRETTLEAKLLK